MDATEAKKLERGRTRLAGIGFGIALASGIAALFAGLGTRWEWWDYRAGLIILPAAALSGLASAALSLFAAFAALRSGQRRAVVFGLHGLIIGALVFGVPWYLLNEGRKVPPIHDISTDTDNPPRFVAVLQVRRTAPNPAEYGGAEIAAQQKKGYPDLAPAMLSVPPRAAFDHAVKIARASGWEIVALAPQDYRIEATATTDWFGFKDDVVVRIAPSGNGSRVDVRSVSRVGVSDLGANARRIREFLRQLVASATG